MDLLRGYAYLIALVVVWTVCSLLIIVAAAWHPRKSKEGLHMRELLGDLLKVVGISGAVLVVYALLLIGMMLGICLWV